MRTLPYSASVEHLRRQAKDLLATLRRADASASLSDAQASLAQQYGYATWPELKRAAEARRADPPATAPEELVAQLVDRFALGAAAGPMVHTDRTWAARVWELEVPAGRVVLSQLEDHVQPDDLDDEVVLVERAIGAGISAPLPIRTRDGAVTTRIGGSAWRAHRWLSAGPAPARPAAPEVAAAAGQALAILHRLALPAPRPMVPWLTCRPTAAAWRDLQAQCRAERPEWADALDRAVPGFLAFDSVLDAEDPDPRAILSHAWLAPDAVRVVGGSGIVVCGWEHASATPRDWELAGALLAWGELGDGTLVPEPAAAFLASYRAATGEEAAVELPMFASGVTGAINWTFSRVNIALNDDRDAEAQADAARSVPQLLAHPIAVDGLTRFLAAVA